MSEMLFHYVILTHYTVFGVCLFSIGVVFTSLPSPPDDLYVAESYVNELDIFTGQSHCVHV